MGFYIYERTFRWRGGMSKLESVVVKDGEFLILSAGSFVLGKASSLTQTHMWDCTATGEHPDIY
jgi:hypothetical protein